MPFQRSNSQYCTDRSPRLLLGLALICAASGCWSEVEYTEPEPKAQTATPATDTDQPIAETSDRPESPTPLEAVTDEDTNAAAGGFGDDLAASLETEESPPQNVEPAETTALDEPAPPQSSTVVGDRYAVTGPVETQAAESEGATASPPPAEDSLFADPPADEAGAEETELAETTPETPATETAPVADPVESLFGESDANDQTPETIDDSMPAEEREAIAETSDVPIANLNDDDIPTPEPQPRNIRRAAWLLGSKLSLAALANDYNSAEAEVQKLLGQSRTLAQILGVTVPDLPASPAAGSPPPVPSPALSYLFTQGQDIGRELARDHGADQAALFEVAVKSNLLLVLYRPGSPTSDAIASAIEQAGPRAKLPNTMWQPLLDTLAARASLADVRKGVYKLHEEADKFLDAPAQQ